jgi:hypothetical protein
MLLDEIINVATDNQQPLEVVLRSRVKKRGEVNRSSRLGRLKRMCNGKISSAVTENWGSGFEQADFSLAGLADTLSYA